MFLGLKLRKNKFNYKSKYKIKKKYIVKLNKV